MLLRLLVTSDDEEGLVGLGVSILPRAGLSAASPLDVSVGSGGLSCRSGSPGASIYAFLLVLTDDQLHATVSGLVGRTIVGR